ncbi:MAG TPA: hypothetical protein PLK37_09700 [Terricaulis sp.]|nr:hypothetical protein [Terricaulis sp.]
MARIREAYVGEDGEVRVARSKRGGVMGVLIALALVGGGVWAFDAVYGDGAPNAELSGAAPN